MGSPAGGERHYRYHAFQGCLAPTGAAHWRWKRSTVVPTAPQVGADIVRGRLMRRGRRDVIRGLASALIVASFAGPGSSRVNAAPAAWQPAADWYPAGLTGRIAELFTPASGAVYAVQRRIGAREIVPTDGVQGDEGLWWSTNG